MQIRDISMIIVSLDTYTATAKQLIQEERELEIEYGYYHCQRGF